MTPPSARARVASGLGLALTLAIVTLTLAEVSSVPSKLAKPGFVASVWASVVGFTFASLLPPLVYAGVFVIAELAFTRYRAIDARRRLIVHAAIAAPFATATYATFVRYPEFAGRLEILGPFVALSIGLALSAAFLGRSVVALSLTVLAAIGVWAANHYMLRARYPTFHLALYQWQLALNFVGLAHLLLWQRKRSARAAGARWQIARLVGVGLASAIVVLGVVLTMGPLEAGRAHARKYTELGRAQVAIHPFSVSDERTRGGYTPDPKGEETFAAHSGLPALPESLDVSRFNILLVMSEAVRFDKTSLADPNRKTTPNLLRLTEDYGAYSFTRAHSPSSATLPSNAAIHSMTFPSSAKLDTWAKSWCGELRAEETTVAELLGEAGYSTFRSSHNHHEGFTRNLLGLGQGFGAERLEIENTDAQTRELDYRIGQHAIQLIDELGQKPDARWFGWVFFAAPHSPYFTRYDDMPKSTSEEKYLQELRYMDEQLGKILDALDQSGRLSNTIVIFTADHGEEFHEHGSPGHRTLYEECTNVPLVVLIPGLIGERIDAPTSSMYVLPWLLSRMEGGPRDAALARMRDHIGPMMKATRGAIVSELVGHDKMLTSLRDRDRTILYDFIDTSTEVYDRRTDPVEQNDLTQTNPAAAADASAIVEGYQTVRSAIHAYKVDHKKQPDRRRGN